MDLEKDTMAIVNPFEIPGDIRKLILDHCKMNTELKFEGKGFICALINSRCPVLCKHCMFGSNMDEAKNTMNTMTNERITNLLKLVKDSNTGYFLVSGGVKDFLKWI